MNNIIRMAYLLDYYGALLTDKQRRIFEMHYLDDLSLSEIAEELGVTPQGVGDLLKRTGKILENYESKLHLLEKDVPEKSEKLKAELDFICAKADEVIDLMNRVKETAAKLAGE